MRSQLRVAILADPVFDHLTGKANGRPLGNEASWLPAIADRLLDQASLTIHWISLARDLREKRLFESGRHRFIEIPAFPKSLDTWVSYRVARRRLLNALGNTPYDLVHCWGSESPYPSVLGHTGLPTLLSMNGILGHLFKLGALPDSAWWKRQARHEEKWLTRADHITVESEWAALALAGLGRTEAVSVLPYGVNPSFYQLTWDPDFEHPYILFAGTLCHGKGFDTLMEALKQLPARNWTCKVAGDGPLRDALLSSGIPNCQWLGQLAWSEYRGILARAALMVLPTRGDSHPNVIKEARVVGLPVITTEAGGQAEYLAPGGNCNFTKVGDSRDLAGLIDTHMSHPERWRAAGAIHHPEDRQALDCNLTAQRLAELYHQLSS